jgi:hypothetical protein
MHLKDCYHVVIPQNRVHEIKNLEKYMFVLIWDFLLVYNMEKLTHDSLAWQRASCSLKVPINFIKLVYTVVAYLDMLQFS